MTFLDLNDGTFASRTRYYHIARLWGQSGLLGLLLVVMLLGCETPSPPPVYPELSFTDIPPIRFSVGEIEVVSGYISPGKAPNIEHEFPYSPEETLWQWAQDRLRVGSGPGRALLTIRSASVRQDDLETEGGVLGLFKREQSARYTANLVVNIEVSDGERSGTATIKVTRSHTFPEDLSLNQRDQARYDFLKDVMHDFNTEAERAISRELGGFLAADNV